MLKTRVSTKHLTVILHPIGDRGRNSCHRKHLHLLPLPTEALGRVALSCSRVANFPSCVKLQYMDITTGITGEQMSFAAASFSHRARFRLGRIVNPFSDCHCHV